MLLLVLPIVLYRYALPHREHADSISAQKDEANVISLDELVLRQIVISPIK